MVYFSKHPITKNQSGFTLVEFLIYIAIIGAILVGFIQFILSTAAARSETRATSEVNANMRFALDIMEQKIHGAQNILTPLEQSSAASIVLDMPSLAPDITFSVGNGVLNLTEQGGSAVPVTSKDVTVELFSVTNHARPGERDNLRISFVVRSNITGVESRYSRAVILTASIRQ